MHRSSTTPDEHIASLADGVRDDIAALDAAISGVMTGHERVLWEGKFWGGSEQHIIGYGAHSYANRSGKTVDWLFVGLAAQKNYLSVFVNATKEAGYFTEQYAGRLGKVKVGRSSIGFKRLGDIELDVLLELIAKARSRLPAAPNG